MRLKKLLAITIFFISSLSLFAVNWTTETKHLAIQGGLQEVMHVSVEPIASQSQSYIMGMPFSVEDTLVQFNYGQYGRLVANISMIANSKFKIVISAPDLAWNKEDSSTIDSWSLPYILTIESDVSYYTVNSVTPRNDNFVFAVKSTTADEVRPSSHTTSTGIQITIYADNADVSLFNENVDYESLVGSAEGKVYFKFANNAKIAEAPDGDYTANVTIRLEPVE